MSKVEKLARIIDPEAFGLPSKYVQTAETDRDEARAKAAEILAVLAAEISSLREALEPFAIEVDSKYEDNESFRQYFSVRDVRRACAALSARSLEVG